MISLGLQVLSVLTYKAGISIVSTCKSGCEDLMS